MKNQVDLKANHEVYENQPKDNVLAFSNKAALIIYRDKHTFKLA